MGVLENIMHNEDAVSDIAAEILILGLVLLLAAVIFVMVFGVMPQIPSTSYLATEISLKEMPGYSAVAIYHRGGDTLNFTGAAGMPGAAQISIITPAGISTAVPDTGLAVFQPGNTIYVYYTGTGYRLVSSLQGVTALPLPTTGMRLTLVDRNSGLLIDEWELLPSAIPVTTTTTTTTPAPGTFNITVSWSPTGLGYISTSPPTPLPNPGTVAVAIGSSKTLSFVPKAAGNKAVKTIVVDGTTVYTGSSNNVTITYTLTNVVSPHTITATFG